MPDENVATPQPTPTPTPSQGINWKNIIIGVVIGAVIFGGGGYLVYNAYQPKKEEPTSTTTTTKTATPSTTTKEKEQSKDETAGWKAYQNKEFGYSIKYSEIYKQSGPDKETNDTNIYFQSKDYKLGGNPTMGLTPLIDGVNIYINANKSNSYPSIKTSGDWEEFNSGYKLSNKRNITIAGVEGFRYDFAGNHGEKLEVAVIVAKNNIYEFWFEAAEEDKINGISIFNDMLSTFKFL